MTTWRPWRDVIAQPVYRGAVRLPLWFGLATAFGFVLAACGAAGTPTAVSGAPIQHGTISVAGIERTYRLYIPAGLAANRPVPLVLVLHAAMDTADQTAAITGFDDVASAHGAIAVYPEGLNGTWNAGICCGVAMHTKVDDSGFISALLQKLERTYRVDPARVYAVGVSNGAILAYQLACSMADRFAAIASVAGSMALDSCHPSAAVSVLEIHGTNDVLVPYQGGRLYPEPEVTIASTPAVAARWASLDSCPGAPASQSQPPVTTETWSGCAHGTMVSLVTVQGGTHTWYAPGLGAADGAVDATQLTSAFIFQHPRQSG